VLFRFTEPKPVLFFSYAFKLALSIICMTLKVAQFPAFHALYSFCLLVLSNKNSPFPSVIARQWITLCIISVLTLSCMLNLAAATHLPLTAPRACWALKPQPSCPKVLSYELSHAPESSHKVLILVAVQSGWQLDSRSMHLHWLGNSITALKVHHSPY